jgi:hypothetical protein
MAPSTSRKQFSVWSEGIFHGLPVLPDSAQGLRAIVVGASGTSGQPLIDVLATDQERWSHVYALSRKRPKGNTPNIKHIPTDLTWDSERLASIFKDNKVDA